MSCQHDRTLPRPSIKPMYPQSSPLTGDPVMLYWCPRCGVRFFFPVTTAGSASSASEALSDDAG
jgi:hypothetical protein